MKYTIKHSCQTWEVANGWTGQHLSLNIGSTAGFHKTQSMQQKHSS